MTGQFHITCSEDKYLYVTILKTFTSVIFMCSDWFGVNKQ